MERDSMSRDLSFWKYKEEPVVKHSEVYVALSDGEEVEGIATLPTEAILKSVEQALAAWERMDKCHFRLAKTDECIELYTTSQFVRFNCYGVSEEHMNTLIDIMLKYGCRLYDSAIDTYFG